MRQEKNTIMLGVDVGGSHITASLIDLANQCVVKSSYVRSHVNTNGTQEEILKVWVSAIQSTMKTLGKVEVADLRLGIAMPGPFDYENGISLIKNMNKYESLYQIDILSHLSQMLGIPKENILFRNDADAFLHGEANCGAAKGMAKVLGITLGTGLGSAVHQNGLTIDANLGISPFRNGIAEDYLSTRWFVKRYKDFSSKPIKDAKPIFDLADSDNVAKKIIDEFSTNLAAFLFDFIDKERPQGVIVGGNIAKAHRYFLEEVNAKLVKLGCGVQVNVSMLWEDAAMIGTACYWNSTILQG